jgi:acetolactate synthase-1/2/3 large subunit
MRAAKLFVKCLEAAGVDRMFGVPGEENLAFLDAVRTSKITFVTTRDEQSAVFMAATVGRLTGRTGVALSTLGPGATNLVTGVAYANLGAMPVLVITGQKPIRASKQGQFQIIDVVRMMEPITKYARTIPSASRIPSMVYEAIKIAESERPGAVHLELPEDIAEEESDEKPMEWRKVRRPNPDDKSVGAAVAMLKKAKAPIIVIGAGANRKLIRNQLRNFISTTGIPFVTTQMGKGVEDESDELYLGTTALSSGDFVHRALEKSDCLLMVGHDIVEKPPVLISSKTNIIHINFSPASVDAVYNPTLEVVGDISHALWALSEELAGTTWNTKVFTKYKKALKNDLEKKAHDDAYPLKPQRIVSDLREAIPHDGVLSLDNGMYKLWIARNYPAYEQNSVLLDNALASMGAGLPVGIATKMMFPEKPVVVLAGDGGFMMNVAELETAVRLKQDLVIVILNDSGYGMIKWKQSAMKLKDFGLTFTNPDFVRLAESFGARGVRITKTAQFRTEVETALRQGGVHVIDVPIDYSENEHFNNLSKHTAKL